MWHTENPKEYGKWYLCRLDGKEIPLLWTICFITGKSQWYMDAGKRYIAIEEPVEWKCATDYKPRFDYK